MSTLVGFVNQLSVPAYKDDIVMRGIDLARSSNLSLSELQIALENRIVYNPRPDHELYAEYLVLAIASSYVGGIRDRSELENYIITKAIENLEYMQEFLDKPDKSEKEYNHRLGMYLIAPAYFWHEYGRNIREVRSGRVYQMRRLLDPDPKVQHCTCCVDYANKGWVNLSDPLPVPGEGCDCLMSCRCKVEYR